MYFHHRGLECKSRKSRITGKFGLGLQNETGQRLTEFCHETMLVIVNTFFTTEEMNLHMDITRWLVLKSD